MAHTACAEPQCLYSTAIPLLPLWAVRPVQSLSACAVQLYLCSPYGPYGLYRASVPVQYSYTSTPRMGSTACTEPQCLYKDALYLFHLRSSNQLSDKPVCSIGQIVWTLLGPSFVKSIWNFSCVSVRIEASQCSHPVESCLALLLAASLLIILRWSRRLQFMCVIRIPWELRLGQKFQFPLLADFNTIDKVFFFRVGGNVFINPP